MDDTLTPEIHMRYSGAISWLPMPKKKKREGLTAGVNTCLTSLNLTPTSQSDSLTLPLPGQLKSQASSTLP